MADEPSLLTDLADFYDALPFEYLLVGHCLLVASWFPKLKDRFLLSYWVGFLAAFAGGVLSALLIQNPKVAPIALLTSNSVGVTWTVCWWLVNYCPGNFVARAMSWLPCRLVARACLNTLRAGLVAARVDLVHALYPGVIAAPLVIGSVAGAGGRFTIDALLAGFGALDAPPELAEPAFAARSAFLGAAGYWAAVHVFAALTPAEGRALIITVAVAHGVLVDLFGWHFDFTHPLAWLAHRLTNVPMPKGHAATLSSSAAHPADSSRRRAPVLESKKGR